MEVDVPPDLFARLPRHPDWRYEYWDGRGRLSHRPRPISCVRPVSSPKSRDDNFDIGPIDADDAEAVAGLVEFVWSDLDPYVSQPTRAEAVAALRAEFALSLERVGGTSSHVVSKLAGVVVGVVELRTTDVAGPGGECAAPMLSWLTVSRAHRRCGVASALLAEVLTVAERAGHTHVQSSFSAANLASLYWHIANGFRVQLDSLPPARA